MKLEDIADMKDYLENRCYCPYEVYDMSGFFYQCFRPEDECELLIEGERGAVHGTFVLAREHSGNGRTQILYIEHRDGRVESCLRVDATENNKAQITAFLNGEVEKMTIDEYRENNTAEDLNRILALADAFMSG